LNAAVEAARAGDAGKGFAVVATEVRTLAQRSSEAAKDIKTLISQSGERVGTGVKLVNTAGDSLMGIIASVTEISTIMSNVASAGREQATGLEEVNGAVTQMDSMTQQNAAMVEQNTATARSLLDESSRLVELMAFFQTDTVRTTAPIISPIMPQSPSAQPQMRLVAGQSAGPADSGDNWNEF
jgi:methyl-accepting chemotaxis protein